MRTETEILNDIQSLSAEIENLQTVAPPESGVALTLQNARQSFTDALKEMLDLKAPGWLPPAVVAASAPAEGWPTVAEPAGVGKFFKKKK